jgi:hypothetical protein
LLQHGSIRLADDQSPMAEPSDREPRHATSLAAEGFPISLYALRRACCQAFAASLEVRFDEASLLPDEVRQARARGPNPRPSDPAGRLQQDAIQRPDARLS